MATHPSDPPTPRIHDATSLPPRPFHDATRPLVGSPCQVRPSTIPGKDDQPVHHPAARP